MAIEANLPEVKFYNTLSRSIEILTPLNPGEVRVYCCGPTVYNFQHIGNLRTYIFEDILIRTLRYAGYRVNHVMNITDVGHLVSDADEGEDKMLVAARREKKKSAEIAQYYTDIFFEHCSWLNIQKPNIVCKATEHITEMIALIEQLEKRGFAYQSGGNVYFDVSKLKDYGKLAGLDLESLQAGARIEVDAKKKNPLDFALWFTKSKFENQELQWNSPWGEGYPGWHIECSAMAMKYLGEQFDIHCGGIDHIPVHHTNEIAQSEAATGKPFVRIWLHGGFLVTEKEKMSKSKGEFLTLDRLKERGFDPLCYRLLCLSGHYRRELAFSWEALEGAHNSFKKIKNSVSALFSDTTEVIPKDSTNEKYKELKKLFAEAVFSDLSMPKALAIFHETLSAGALSSAEKLSLVVEFDTIFGFGVENWKEVIGEVPNAVLELAEKRELARTSKNWSESDRLREMIKELGYSVEDTKDGQKIKKHNKET